MIVTSRSGRMQSQGRSVLIIRFLALGDVLYTLPIIEALARSETIASVDLLTSSDFAGIARRNSSVRNVIQVELDGEAPPSELNNVQYDIAIDLHSRTAPLPTSFEVAVKHVVAEEYVGYRGSPVLSMGPGRALERRRHGHGREGEYFLDYYSRAVSPLLSAPLGMGLVKIAEHELRAARQGLHAHTVCLAVGARYPWKQWPPERYAALALKLKAQGTSPLIVGHFFDQEFVNTVHALSSGAAEKFTGDIHSLSALMAASGLVIANCSGLSHLGSATGARVICIHSHTLPSMYAPWGEGHANVVGVADHPCLCLPPGSPFPDIPCGHSISVEQVLGVALKQIADLERCDVSSHKSDRD